MSGTIQEGLATMADDAERPIRKGTKGGKKHTPGRGHTRKSQPHKTKRFEEKAARKRKQQHEEARRLWDAYDRLSNDVKRLLGPEGVPPYPRPDHGNQGAADSA